MSLDIVLFKKCPPEEATNAFLIADNPELANIQPSGVLCAKQVFYRIGRNCMGHKWHIDFDNETTPIPRLSYLPNDWQEIKNHFPPEFKEGQFFTSPPEGGWDFMYISW